MKLFLVHCGFSQRTVGAGIYEAHADLFVIAEDFEEARTRAKELPEYKAHRMHIDGLVEIRAVQGYRIEARRDASLAGATETPAQHGFAIRGRKKKPA